MRPASRRSSLAFQLNLPASFSGQNSSTILQPLRRISARLHVFLCVPQSLSGSFFSKATSLYSKRGLEHVLKSTTRFCAGCQEPRQQCDNDPVGARRARFGSPGLAASLADLPRRPAAAHFESCSNISEALPSSSMLCETASQTRKCFSTREASRHCSTRRSCSTLLQRPTRGRRCGPSCRRASPSKRPHQRNDRIHRHASYICAQVHWGSLGRTASATLPRRMQAQQMRLHALPTRLSRTTCWRPSIRSCRTMVRTVSKPYSLGLPLLDRVQK